jgi:pyruvate/2-oxoglutarate/acetoin dehydrogenase E1 component
MSQSLREVIKCTVKDHLESGYIALGQCLTAVGWVGGTLPEKYEEDGMIELSMADVAGGAIAVGAALAGARPIYVIRYQGFNWYNAPSIVNYACKSKEIWKRPCPMFVRSIAMEGGIGPVAGSSHTSLYYRMPGINIVCPMTPNEYRESYRRFMEDDSVYYVSEHRGAFPNTVELNEVIYDSPDVVLIAISITRFRALEAAEKLRDLGVKAAVHHVFSVKPLELTESARRSLTLVKHGFYVLDDDYVDGIAKNIAMDLATQFSKKCLGVMGLANRSAGFAPHLDNLPPNQDQITARVYSDIGARK